MTVRIQLTPSDEWALETVCLATIGDRELEVHVNGRSGRLSRHWFDETEYAISPPRKFFTSKELRIEKAGQEIGATQLKQPPFRAFLRWAISDVEWEFQEETYLGRIYPCRVDIHDDTGRRVLATRRHRSAPAKAVFVCRGSLESPHSPILFAMVLTLAFRGLLDPEDS